ncbi:MAG: alpha/beta hydrolase [Elusimicrobiota bacterium]
MDEAISWALLLCAGAGLAYFALRIFEQINLYFPDRRLSVTPDNIGLDYEDVSLVSADNIRLHGWFMPLDSPAATILFLHGNAGNISTRLETYRHLLEVGLQVFAFDYRGYGQSKGKPSENGLYTDADVAYRYLTHERRIPSRCIVLYGESLGGAVAAQLATKTSVAGIITEGTLSNIIDMAKYIYPFLPAHRLVSQKFDTATKLRSVTAPKLIIHSQDDDVVPYALGEKLFAAAAEPKEFFPIHGGHSSGRLEMGPVYWEKIRAFADSVVKS